MKKTKSHQHWIKDQFDPALYSRVWKQRWNVFEDKPIENIPELFMCLRKIVNADQSRIDILSGIYKMHNKCIVFYNFDYELDILRAYCNKRGIPYSEWNGHKHQMIPEADNWLYLVQYTAGAEGWNCTETDTVIFWSLNYSYKILEQSCGRIDRLNTPFVDLFYYHIYSSSRIDIAIKDAIANKKTFNEKAFMDSREKHVT
jgi:superfamily II DNA or RNA helicase